MALRINKPVELFNWNEIYSRIRVWFNERGDRLDVWLLNYPSKEAFKADTRNALYIPDILPQYQFDYDRERDGADILLFCHEKIKGLLTTDVTEEREFVSVVDGRESKENQKIIIKEKFCEPEEIEIILN